MTIILIGVLGIITFFVVLQKISDKTYKPTKADIKHKLRAVIDGSIGHADFDELISVRIAYDASLEEIVNKLNDILDDPSNIKRPHSKAKTIDLSELGKKRVKELIKELETT